MDRHADELTDRQTDRQTDCMIVHVHSKDLRLTAAYCCKYMAWLSHLCPCNFISQSTSFVSWSHSIPVEMPERSVYAETEPNRGRDRKMRKARSILQQPRDSFVQSFWKLKYQKCR